MLWSKKYNISLQNVLEWKYKVVEEGNTQVQEPQNGESTMLE